MGWSRSNHRCEHSTLVVLQPKLTKSRHRTVLSVRIPMFMRQSQTSPWVQKRQHQVSDPRGQIMERNIDISTPALLSNLQVCQSWATARFYPNLTHLQKVVNATWRLEGNSIAKLSRWIRCLFQIALTSDVYVAEHLLDQTANLVEEAKVRCSTFVASLPSS